MSLSPTHSSMENLEYESFFTSVWKFNFSLTLEPVFLWPCFFLKSPADAKWVSNTVVVIRVAHFLANSLIRESVFSTITCSVSLVRDMTWFTCDEDVKNKDEGKRERNIKNCAKGNKKREKVWRCLTKHGSFYFVPSFLHIWSDLHSLTLIHLLYHSFISSSWTDSRKRKRHFTLFFILLLYPIIPSLFYSLVERVRESEKESGDLNKDEERVVMIQSVLSSSLYNSSTIFTFTLHSFLSWITLSSNNYF